MKGIERSRRPDYGAIIHDINVVFPLLFFSSFRLLHLFLIASSFSLFLLFPPLLRRHSEAHRLTISHPLCNHRVLCDAHTWRGRIPHERLKSRCLLQNLRLRLFARFNGRLTDLRLTRCSFSLLRTADSVILAKTTYLGSIEVVMNNSFSDSFSNYQLMLKILKLSRFSLHVSYVVLYNPKRRGIHFMIKLCEKSLRQCMHFPNFLANHSSLNYLCPSFACTRHALILLSRFHWLKVSIWVRECTWVIYGPLREFSQYILDILYLLAAWNNFSPRHWIELKRVEERKTSNR